MPQTPERKRQYYLERKSRKGSEMRAVAAAWRDANRGHLRAQNRKRRLNKRAMCLMAAGRVRARRKGILFELTVEDLSRLQAVIDAGKCELSGVAFTLEGPRCATSPSLDRKDSSRGYVSDNVRVICHALNAALGDWGEEALRPIMLGWIS